MMLLLRDSSKKRLLFGEDFTDGRRFFYWGQRALAMNIPMGIKLSVLGCTSRGLDVLNCDLCDGVIAMITSP